MHSQGNKPLAPLRVISNATLILTTEDGSLIRESNATQVLASSVEFSGVFDGDLFSAIFYDGAKEDGVYTFLTEGNNNTACRYLGDGFFHQLNAKIVITVSNQSTVYDAVITGHYFDGNQNIHAHMSGHFGVSK